MGAKRTHLLRQQRLVQVLQAGQRDAVQLQHSGHVHGRGEGVVAAHAHVHVVVGVHGLLAAHLAAHQLDGPVGHHLVHVHVGLRARAGLIDD